MTATPFDGTDPRAELARSANLARQVRRSQRATWFPLLVFAALTFLAVPVTRTGHPTRGTCSPAHATSGLRVCVVHNSAAFVYWPIAFVAGYALIAAFYVRQSRRRGVGPRVAPYVGIGIAIAIAATVASAWANHATPPAGDYQVLFWHLHGADVYRLIGPACVIGVGLLVLAGVERNAALLAVAITFLVIALGGITFGWTIGTGSRWAFAPHLIVDGSLLLIAAGAFAVAQRHELHP